MSAIGDHGRSLQIAQVNGSASGEMSRAGEEIMKTLMQALVLMIIIAATVPVNAATCEFNVPEEEGVFTSAFKVVGSGTTSEKALADAIKKCFSRYERSRGGRAPDDDNSRKAIDLCANPPGC